jgi:hypothetical protein
MQVNVEIARRDLGRAVRELVDHNWAVFADGSKVRQAGGLRFRVSSDVDWFDVHTDVDFEGRSAFRFRNCCELWNVVIRPCGWMTDRSVFFRKNGSSRLA